ncbi:MAG TPA: cupin domain-containing protein [Gemmatimonadaceae bacterium]|jgi:mannose-6-phosphate isomerase-like protein (cupin superfamily)|nr:cupin domain-containing protein [Gemmatimonadota bacterium]HNV74209.1 cupin domain-containing protein [Gemmatimonadaceae bacterium]HPV74468.1 cupin domain-containing protein [Gemmatimonadaceae bacterium]
MTEIKRRSFLGIALAAIPLAARAESAVEDGQGKAVYVRAGEDRTGTHKTLGISTIDFKVTSADSGGAMLVIENTNRGKGGPARHLHVDQDELFYVIEGEYAIEVGGERFALRSGDSILAPRQVPHVWAYVGETRGRLLISFTPPGKMEAFFREVSKTNAMPMQDPRLWREHGMELLGPPLTV